MKKQEFESRVLKLWMTTAIPLTAANLQYHTGLARKAVDSWLDELVGEGTLSLDIVDDTLVYSVPGATRPAGGAKNFAEYERLESLRGESRSAPVTNLLAGGVSAGALAKRAKQDLAAADGKKSALLSGGLSFFLGPLGWLYAGAWREAIPASAVALLVAYILPTFLLLPLFPFAAGLSGLAGVAYARQYNRKGERSSLWGKKDEDS